MKKLCGISVARAEPVRIIAGPPAWTGIVAACLAGLGESVLIISPPDGCADLSGNDRIIPAIPEPLFCRLAAAQRSWISSCVKPIVWSARHGENVWIGDTAASVLQIQQVATRPAIETHWGYWEIRGNVVGAPQPLPAGIRTVSAEQIICRGRRFSLAGESAKNRCHRPQQLVGVVPEQTLEARFPLELDLREQRIVVPVSSSQKDIQDIPALRKLQLSALLQVRRRECRKALIRGPAWWYDICIDL